MENIEIWKFLAGLGLFLFGMNQIEIVLKSISGRQLKLFLIRNTQSLFKSIVGGAVVTGIVQSSSVVSLIALAFVESGIISFRSTLGIILGSNVGTTLSGWVVATVGFKFDILSYSFPVIAIAGMGAFFCEKRRNLHSFFSVFFALGILFLGLSFIKEAALQLVGGIDLQLFVNYHLIVFVLIGFVLTTIIQSSSATVVIALTAIYAGILNFQTAAAIVIGAEIGTSIKILFWGMKGSADKKRVAWGNFIFNILTGFIAFITLHWHIYFIENIVNIKDPLIGLVFFQTSINIITIILFVPFLNIFSIWLEKKFQEDTYHAESYISKNLPMLPVLAIDALRNEAIFLIKKIMLFNKIIMCDEKKHIKGLIGNIKSFTEIMSV